MRWTTDEYGTRRFTDPSAPGWDITIYSQDPGAEIYVETGISGTSVDVTRDGIEVFGEDTRGWNCSGVRFTIPWAIMHAIIEVQSRN